MDTCCIEGFEPSTSAMCSCHLILASDIMLFWNVKQSEQLTRMATQNGALGARVRCEAEQVLPHLQNQRTSNWIREWVAALTHVLDALQSNEPITVEERINKVRSRVPSEYMERFERLVAPVNEVDDETTQEKLIEEIAWHCNSKCIDVILKADKMEEPDEDLETRTLRLIYDLRREFEKILGQASSSSSDTNDAN